MAVLAPRTSSIYPRSYFQHSALSSPQTLQVALSLASLPKLKKARLVGYMASASADDAVSYSGSTFGEWGAEESVEGVAYKVMSKEEERRLWGYVGVGRTCRVAELDIDMNAWGVLGWVGAVKEIWGWGFVGLHGKGEGAKAAVNTGMRVQPASEVLYSEFGAPVLPHVQEDEMVFLADVLETLKLPKREAEVPRLKTVLVPAIPTKLWIEGLAGESAREKVELNDQVDGEATEIQNKQLDVDDGDNTEPLQLKNETKPEFKRADPAAQLINGITPSTHKDTESPPPISQPPPPEVSITSTSTSTTLPPITRSSSSAPITSAKPRKKGLRRASDGIKNIVLKYEGLQSQQDQVA